MSGRLENNAQLANALHDNKPFVYAYLVKFERPVVTTAGGSERAIRQPNGNKFSYITDAGFDIIFDDGSTAKDSSGNIGTNGPRTYVANKLLSIGTFSESTELKITNTSLVLDATPLDTSVSAEFTFSSGANEVTNSNIDLSAAGFRPGDTFTVSGVTGLVLHIVSFKDDGKTIVYETREGTPPATNSAVQRTLTLLSEEITSVVRSTVENRINFINRKVKIFKAFFHADAPHTFIGTPVELFSGTVTNVAFEEDPEKGAKVTWTLASFLADFRKIKGRLTSHEFHQGYTTEGGVNAENAIRKEYADDRGFEYSELSLNLLATYIDTEKELRYRDKDIGPFGIFGSTQEAYEVDVEVSRDVDLRFDLQAKHIPVIYGVRRTKGIPIFADLSSQLTANKESEVFLSHAICEGPIQSVLNVFVDDNALVCMGIDDAKARNPTFSGSTPGERVEAANADIKCIGRADSGEVLGGDTILTGFQPYTSTSLGYMPQTLQTSEGYAEYSAGNFGGVDAPKNRLFSDASVGFTVGTTGLTHGRVIKFSQPVPTTLEFHAGLSDQIASNMLTTQARSPGFKLQGSTSNTDYYTSKHKVLDTAYMAGKYTIGAENSSIPSVDFIVKGKMIQSYNYDGSFSHSQLSSYSAEDHTKFKAGDTVTLHSSINFTDTLGTSYTATQTLMTVTVLEKFFFIDHKRQVQYRFRWLLSSAQETLLQETKRFYMQKGSDQWHMVAYDSEDILDVNLITGVKVAEVFEAELAQTSSGSSQFQATLNNKTVSNENDYTLNNAHIMFFVESPEIAPGIPDFGASSYKERTQVLEGNIINITGGNAVTLSGTASTSTLPANTKMVVANQIKLSNEASNISDIYNGQTIRFLRRFSSSAAATIGTDELIYERKVVDYNGSTRVVTLDDEVPYGRIKVNDEVTFISESTEDSSLIEESSIKAGDLRPSTNFALITLDYLKSNRYGIGLEEKEINLTDFLLAAVECDTQSDVDILFMATSPGAAFTVKAGDVYEYKDSGTGHLKWRGTVKEDKDSSNFGGQTVTFTNVTGKLTNLYNDFTEREIGDLVYDTKPGSPTGLQVITTQGLQTNSVTDNSSANINTAITKVSGDASSAASLVLTVGQGHTNPVMGYSLYDSDFITYWKYLGWEEKSQRYVTRHQGNLSVDTSKPVLDNLKGILQHFNGLLYPSEGKMRLRVEAARASGGEESDANFTDANSDVDVKIRYITDEDIIGKISLKDPGLAKASNSVSASIADPAMNFDNRSVSFFDSTYKKEDNGIVKSANITIPGITNYFNARMAAKQLLDRSRFSREISFTMRPSGFAILPGQLIRVKYPRFGWEAGSEVIFRVRSISISKDCLVSITAREYNDSIYRINKNIQSPFFVDTLIPQASRTPGAPTMLTPQSASTASPNIIRWSAAAGISEVTGRYEVWRATSFSGNAATDVTSHAEFLESVPAFQTELTDLKTSSPTAENFIYWVRAYNESAPQTTSGRAGGGTRRYYGPFNDDSDYGGVGQAAAAQLALKALQESIVVDLTTESIALPANSSGVVSDFSNGSGTISVFIGTTALSQGTSFTIGTPSVSSGAGTTVTVTGANYSLSGALNTESATISFPITILANATTGLAANVTRTAVMNIAKTRSGATGAAGASGRTVELDPSSNVINYNTAGAETDTITFTATARNFTGTPFYQFFVGPVGGTFAVKQAYSTTNTFTLADSDEPAIGGTPVKVIVQTKDGGSGGAVIAQDSVTIFPVQDGADAVTGLLTNETHAVNANFLGAGIASFANAGGTFRVFVGGQDVTSSCTFSVHGTPSGVSIAISNTTGSKGVYTVSGLTLDNGIASLKAVVPAATAGTAADVDIIKIYTISKSKNAAPEVKGELTTPSATVAANSAGTVTTATLNTAGGTFNVRKDGVNINSSSDVSFAIQGSVTPSSGFTVGIDSSTGVYTISNFTVDHGQVTFRATVNTGISGLANTTTIDKVYTISRAKEGVEAITIDVSNPVVNVPTTNAGVSTLSSTGTDISVKEGSTPLSYATSGVGTFSIVASGTNITAGAASLPSSTIRRFAAASNITADEAFITFTVTIRRGTGAAAETRSVIQRIVKAKEGDKGDQGDQGDQGDSVVEVQTFRKNSTSGLSGGSYNFNTSTLTPPSGWSVNPPSLSANGDIVYVAKGTSVGTSTTTSASISWGTTAVYAQRTDGTNGSPGATGARTASAVLYYQSSSTNPPTAPTVANYNFSTGLFGSHTSGWDEDAPVFAAANTNKYWYVRITVSEASFGGTQSFDGQNNVLQGIGFTGLVTFTSNTISDGTNSLNTSGSGSTTTIDGGSITSNSIEASRLKISSSTEKTTMRNAMGAGEPNQVTTAFTSSTSISGGTIELSSSGTTLGQNQTITSTSQSILLDAASSNGPRILVTDST